MLTIICGEDVVASRNYFTNLKKDSLFKGFEVKELRFEDVSDISHWLADSPLLFSLKKIFFSENINKKIKKENKNLLQELQAIANLKDVDLIDWENVSSRDLKISKIGKIKEFKPDQNIFKLTESLYPTNKINFIDNLTKLSSDLDENFILIMLVRQLRNLILVKEGVIPPRMQSWQTFKLKSQAKYWKINNLILFYEALFKVEIGLKTSSSPFSIKESLEILACHFL